ncbi:MAG: ribonuclease HII [candidate division WOR-3 bacterium]
MTLLPFYNQGQLEIGVDEAGRGPIFGRVYAGAVIWPSDLVTPIVQDSKKYTNINEREKAYDYILDHAIAYGIGYVEAKEIDTMGIYKAVMKAMNIAIRNTFIHPDHILVDGKYFLPDMDLLDHETCPQFTTIIDGDNKYLSIAAGSILAKVEHDRYINHLCDQYPLLERYDLQKNKGYGTPNHLKAIKEYGLTQFHRQSFKCCQGLPVISI